MRHLVRVEPEWTAANELDTNPEGPGPLFKKIGERFRPEAFDVEAARRAAHWVIDFNDAAGIPGSRTW